MDFWTASGTFVGEDVTVGCDGKCYLSWGRARREGRTDVEAIAAFGPAPEDPGTREGGEAKPIAATGGGSINKWCVRQCERCVMSAAVPAAERPEVPMFDRKGVEIHDRIRQRATELRGRSEDVTALQFVAETALDFGEITRATRHSDGVTPETDTTHTVMLQLAAITVLDAHHVELRHLSREMVLIFALVHDLPEAYAGDVDTQFGLSDAETLAKAKREERAMRVLDRRLNGTRIMSALRGYHAQRVPEAQFVRYLDKIMPKLTHLANECTRLVEQGIDAAQYRSHRHAQFAELKALYPDFPMLDRLYWAVTLRVCETLDMATRP